MDEERGLSTLEELELRDGEDVDSTTPELGIEDVLRRGDETEAGIAPEPARPGRAPLGGGMGTLALVGPGAADAEAVAEAVAAEPAKSPELELEGRFFFGTTGGSAPARRAVLRVW